MSEDAAGLGRYSHPLASMRPDSEALRPFTDTVEDAAIVGLGEATHGTREFFELKGAVLRHLVADCGVRTVALETDFATTLALDEYIRTGDGSAVGALDNLVLWVWRVESIRATVEWLRTFNEGRPPGDRVRAVGVSLSDPSAPASRLRALLREVAQIPVPGRLDALADDPAPDDAAARESFLDSGVAVAESLRDRLDTYRPAVVDTRSSREWTLARRLCRHLEQTCEWNRLRLATEGFDPEAFEQRDRHMAETVGWCRETDPGDGVAVWAHNTHVKRGSFDIPQDWAAGETMGEVIAQDHGSAYRPYATDFTEGRYRAVADGTDSETFAASGPPTEVTAATLEAVDAQAGFLDIESAAADPRLDSWFERDRELRAVAALVDPDAGPSRRRMETDLAASFDGLFAVETTEPSVPL
jgi:erythromycin esterase